MSIGAIVVVACGLLCWSLVGGWTNGQEYRHKHSVYVGIAELVSLEEVPCSGLSGNGGGSEA